MKIYTKVVFNMVTGEEKVAESFEYEGPVAQCFGGSKSPSPPAPPPPPNVQPIARTAATTKALGQQLDKKKKRIGQQATILTGGLGLEPEEVPLIGKKLLSGVA